MSLYRKGNKCEWHTVPKTLGREGGYIHFLFCRPYTLTTDPGTTFSLLSPDVITCLLVDSHGYQGVSYTPGVRSDKTETSKSKFDMSRGLELLHPGPRDVKEQVVILRPHTHSFCGRS